MKTENDTQLHIMSYHTGNLTHGKQYPSGNLKLLPCTDPALYDIFLSCGDAGKSERCTHTHSITHTTERMESNMRLRNYWVLFLSREGDKKRMLDSHCFITQTDEHVEATGA